jgi:hypothetical protein
MSLFSSPSAASKMIRARWANPCAVFRRDAKPPSSRRSLSLNSMATAVLPIANPPRIILAENRTYLSITTLVER